jgi:hypothetical protein
MKTPSDPVSPKEDRPDFKDELFGLIVSLFAALVGLSLFFLLAPYDTDNLTLPSIARWLGLLIGVIGLYGIGEMLFRLAIVALAIALSGYWLIFVLLFAPLILFSGLLLYAYTLLID